MNAPNLHAASPRTFESLRAKDLMTPNPISIRHDATIHEALELLTDRGFGAAPVIDERGLPVGVVSRTDILTYERECVGRPYASKCIDSARDCTDWDIVPEPTWLEVPPDEWINSTRVSEIMTPAIFTVALDTPASEVVRRILDLNIHHLFVSDSDFSIVGVISPLDVLRGLKDK
jgi:CBS domain-containing protein